MVQKLDDIVCYYSVIKYQIADFLGNFMECLLSSIVSYGLNSFDVAILSAVIAVDQ